MDRDKAYFLLLNIGHFLDHLFTLVFATVAALVLYREWNVSYAELLAYATPGFFAFGLFSAPAGWIADKWSKDGMMCVFLICIGLASIATGFAQTPLQIGIGLFVIGMFAAIYHPVGIAMVAENARSLGKELGINGVFGNFGVAAAAIVAGTLTDLISWRAAFIIPGVVSIATGLAYMVFSRNAPEPHHLAKKDKFIGATRSEIRRAIAVVILASIPGMLIFNATTNALPKVFDERLGDLASNLSQVGMWTFAVFVVASIAQVIMGIMLDKYRLKPIYVTAVAFQAPTVFLVAYAYHMGMLGAAAAMMFVTFSIIPIHDTIIARFTNKEFRSRVFALKYLVGLCVGAAALPMVGWMHESMGGFQTVFLVLAGFAAIQAMIAMFLPARDHLTQADSQPEAQPAE